MKKETRKQEITRVAAKLFKEKGYTAVTMRDLAAAMGIKAASLYNHIDSKQTILQDLIIAIAEDFTNGMQNIIAFECSSLEKLEKIIALHIKIATTNANGLAALNSDWMHLKHKLDYYLKLRQDYENNVKHIIQNGIARHEIKNIDPDVMVFSMLTTLRSLYLWIPKKEISSIEDLKASLTKILLTGINK